MITDEVGYKICRNYLQSQEITRKLFDECRAMKVSVEDFRIWLITKEMLRIKLNEIFETKGQPYEDKILLNK